MMDRTGVDRRPGINVPIKQPERTARFAHLARSGPAKQSFLTPSSAAVATFVALALVCGFDGYFFDGYYGSSLWKVFQQIGRAFRF